MRVLITGASGFVGVHLVRLLLANHCEVAALIQPNHPAPRLDSVRQHLQVIDGGLDNVEELRPALHAFKPEVCFHLAWYAQPGTYLYSPHNLALLTGSIQLFQLLIEVGCEQIVATGTCAEYDTDFGYLQETSPTRPSTIYAATKLSLSIVGQQMAQDAGIRFAWARLFYLYGTLEDERRMIPTLIRTLLQGKQFPATAGAQIRDYLYVEDIARALWMLAQKQLSGIFNIASGEPISIHHLMEMVGNLLGRSALIQFGEVPYRDWEPMFICGNPQKLKQQTGWQPRYTLAEGLIQTIEWYQQFTQS